MTHRQFRYRFEPAVSFEEVEQTLVLAALAAESLHGTPVIRLEVGHVLDPEHGELVLDADSNAARDLNRLFLGLILHGFGPDAVHVEPVAASAA